MRGLAVTLAVFAPALLAWAGAASAQERAPTDRQALSALAYTLGEAHALHRVCAGPRDGTWFNRMRRLIEVERPDEALRRRLIEAFNAGYLASGAEYPACSPNSEAAERAAAARARPLARNLAR